MKLEKEKIKAKAKELADKAEETLQKGVKKAGEFGLKVINFGNEHPLLFCSALSAGLLGLVVASEKANEFQDADPTLIEKFREGVQESRERHLKGEDGDSVMELLTNLSDNINLKHGEGVFIEGNENGGNTICHYEKNLVLPEEEE